MRTVRGLFTAACIVLIATLTVVPCAAAPEGQMTWFDPAETSGIGLVAGDAFFSAPYEDVRLKAR